MNKADGKGQRLKLIFMIMYSNFYFNLVFFHYIALYCFILQGGDHWALKSQWLELVVIEVLKHLPKMIFT